MSDLKKRMKRARKEVWNALDIGELQARCLMDEEAYHALGQVTTTRDGPYVYIDNHSDVLAIAHLDTVIDSDIFAHVVPTRGQDVGYEYVYAPTLDDRLGAYVILDLLPRLGITVDVLLTTGEEKGKSTAAYFEPVKDYHWMLQFDRRGNDVVMYNYESKSNRARLGRFDFEIGAGSFSDICYLEHLKVAGFNFGVGYHDEHYVNCYANLNETVDQVGRFGLFYKAFASETIAYNYQASWNNKSKSKRSVHWYTQGGLGSAKQYTNDWEEMDAAFEAAVKQESNDLDTRLPQSETSLLDSWVKLNMTASGWVRVEGIGRLGEVIAFQMKVSIIRPYLTIGQYTDLINKGSLNAKLILDDLIDAAAGDYQGRYQ